MQDYKINNMSQDQDIEQTPAFIIAQRPDYTFADEKLDNEPEKRCTFGSQEVNIESDLSNES